MDTEFKDLYSILELETSASELEIKANFKKLALKYHPDKNKDDKSSGKYYKKKVKISF